MTSTTYAYRRVSTAEQAGSGLGLEAQQAAIRAALGEDSGCLRWVTDVGVSGSVDPRDRPAAGPMLGAIGRHDTLIVARLDRLGRSCLDVLNLADEADRKGWNLRVLDLGLDTSTPVGRFTLTALAAVAQLERDLIAQRTSEALQAAKRRGVRLGRGNLGAALSPDQRRDIVSWRADEGLTYRAIAGRCNERGWPTPSGKGARWDPSQARNVCRTARLDDEATCTRDQTSVSV